MRMLTEQSNLCRLGAGTLVMMLGIAVAPNVAAGSTVFTWDPAEAIPPLAPPGSAFTADAIDGTHYLYSVQPLTSLPPSQQTPYTVSFIEQIQQFTLGGVPVSTPGLNGTPGAAGSYGLYLTMQANVQYVGPPKVYQYNSLNVSLMADPGNNDGAVIASASGLRFSNTGVTGTADDIPLATGSLVSSAFSFNPATGTRVGDFTETLQAAPGEAAFFETPLDPETLINEILTTPPSVFFTDTGSTTSATWITGGSAVISFDVPEPATFSLLGAALAGLLGLRGRAGKNV